MSTAVMKTVNFGKSKTGIATVGYTLYDTSGTVYTPRTSAGVFEIGMGTGIYGANITFASGFNGTILWDTGQGASTVYAMDEYNGLEEDLLFIKAVTGGRWKLDPINNFMIFYAEDNLTQVAKFSMYNSVNQPSVLEVHQRIRNDDGIDPNVLVEEIDP